MTTTKKLTIPDSEAVKQEGIQILIEQMGFAKAAVFIRSALYQKGLDYLQLKDERFGHLSVAEIVQEMQDEHSEMSL